ncbi:acyltransferase family protein [Gorillibacterium sp. sgz5001074]|uniref:acyltransferase family protein n=1 Tax=Gorillibacterium sp. sgz5001074 TaxID=3446695 RepID=UPI003F664849
MRLVSIESAMNTRRNNFDFLRLIAAVLVIFSHSFPISLGGNKSEPIYKLTNGQFTAGELSVIVFFVISGFLITKSFDRTKNVGEFFIARVLRIFPALVVVVLLTTFILGPAVSTSSILDYLTNKQTYTYLTTILLHPIGNNGQLPHVFSDNVLKSAVNGSLWTLQFEFICYIIVGVMGAMRMLRKDLVVILLLSSIVISHLNISNYTISNAVYFTNYFAAGMIIYLFRNKVPLTFYLAITSVTALIFASVYGVLKEALIPFGSYLVFYFSLSPQIKMPNVTKKFGDYSYGLYIYAFPLQQIISNVMFPNINPYTLFLFSFIPTLILAILSWHFIEKRAIALKGKINWATFKRKALANTTQA